MAKRGEGLTGKIRSAALEMGKGGVEFKAEDLAHKAGIQTHRDKQRMHWMLRDLKRRGELVSSDRGSYRVEAKRKDEAPPPKNEVMWRFLRMNRTVTVEDLQEVAGVSANYARQWIRHLLKREIVRELAKGLYQLIKDGLESPSDVEKAEKLRELRARKKEQAMACLEGLGSLIQSMETSLLSARSALNSAQAWVSEVEA